MTEIDAVLEQLLAATGASRVTLRQDVPGDVFPVTHEALADGTPLDQRAWPRRTWPDSRSCSRSQQGRQVVQDDCLAASDEPHFRAMLELYGGLRAQIVTPVVRGRARRGDRLAAPARPHAARGARRRSTRRARGRGGSASCCESRSSAHNRWHPGLPPVGDGRARRRGHARLHRGRHRRPAHAREHARGLRDARPRARRIRSRGPSTSRARSPATCSRSSSSSYEPADFGTTAVIPGFGFLADLFPEPYLVKWEIADGVARSEELPGVAVPAGHVRRRRRRRAVAGAARRLPARARSALRERGQPVADSMPEGAVPPAAADGAAHDPAARDGRQHRHPAARRGRRSSGCRSTCRARCSRSATSTSRRATARSAARRSRSRAR